MITFQRSPLDQELLKMKMIHGYENQMDHIVHCSKLNKCHNKNFLEADDDLHDSNLLHLYHNFLDNFRVIKNLKQIIH